VIILDINGPGGPTAVKPHPRMHSQRVPLEITPEERNMVKKNKVNVDSVMMKNKE
jgi:hypothetical protein